METNFSDQFQRLFECLTEQNDVYLRISEVLQSEKKYLILADIQSLIENNKLKEALLAKSRALEKIRPLRVVELLRSLNQEPKDRPVSEILPLMPKEQAKKLIEVQAELNKVLQNLRAINQANDKLVSNAKNVIDSGLKVFRGEGTQSQIYKKQGKLEKGKAAGKIVSKEV